MKKHKYLILSLPFYLISLLSTVLYVFTELYPRIYLSPLGRLCLIGISCIFLYIGSFFICRTPSANKNRIMKITFFIFFIFYVSLLLNFTLFDPMFGRNGRSYFIFSDKSLLKSYMENSFNLIPFATVFEYIKALFTGNIGISDIATNLFGNLVAFMPMALFLPMFIQKCKKTGYFLLFVSSSVVVIEVLQLVLVTGSCDIDDLILNVFGAFAAYCIFKLKPIEKIIKKIMLYS